MCKVLELSPQVLAYNEKEAMEVIIGEWKWWCCQKEKPCRPIIVRKQETMRSGGSVGDYNNLCLN